MSCQDILINRSIEFNKIQTALSQIFAINSSDILVVDEVPQTPIQESTRILCQAQEISGDFKQLVTIYLRDDSLNSLLTSDTISKLCQRLKCECLISDDSDNPYSMILIRGENDYQTAYLLPEYLEQEQYVLS
jgi:hypothetical protein